MVRLHPGLMRSVRSLISGRRRIDQGLRPRAGRVPLCEVPSHGAGLRREKMPPSSHRRGGERIRRTRQQPAALQQAAEAVQPPWAALCPAARPSERDRSPGSEPCKTHGPGRLRPCRVRAGLGLVPWSKGLQAQELEGHGCRSCGPARESLCTSVLSKLVAEGEKEIPLYLLIRWARGGQGKELLASRHGRNAIMNNLPQHRRVARAQIAQPRLGGQHRTHWAREGRKGALEAQEKACSEASRPGRRCCCRPPRGSRGTCGLGHMSAWRVERATSSIGGGRGASRERHGGPAGRQGRTQVSKGLRRCPRLSRGSEASVNTSECPARPASAPSEGRADPAIARTPGGVERDDCGPPSCGKTQGSGA